MSSIYWGKEESQYSKVDARQLVAERFWALAVARSLQSARYADVMAVRSFVGGNTSCNAPLGGLFSTLKNAGAVVGTEGGGKDEKGYPYKRWVLADPEKAKAALGEKHIRPMRTSAMERWQVHP